MSDRKRIRLELDERRARAVHAAIREAINGKLLAGDHLDAAHDVLGHLDARVPGWLDVGPICGEAGYLVAAEAVLRALVDAEDRGRDALSESELLQAVGDAKPLGSTATDVLDRMRHEKLISVRAGYEDSEAWMRAQPAGRRLLHRNAGAQDDAWTVHDADALVDLIYAEHRAGGDAHRASVQAIGRLSDERLGELVDVLVGLGLLDAPKVPVSSAPTLHLTAKGIDLARERWKESAPPGVYRSTFINPPPPAPLPYQRRLPLRITREDRNHPPRYDDSPGAWCPPANWLQSNSKTKLFATLKRDGAVQWTCQHCHGTWLVYLQAFTAAGEPAYADLTTGAYNRPQWRGTFRY